MRQFSLVMSGFLHPQRWMVRLRASAIFCILAKMVFLTSVGSIVPFEFFTPMGNWIDLAYGLRIVSSKALSLIFCLRLLVIAGLRNRKLIAISLQPVLAVAVKRSSICCSESVSP